MGVALFVITAAAGLTCSAAAYTTKQAVEMYRITHENRVRIQTNRQALREIVEQEDIDIDADPLTGLGGSNESGN
jgi:ABC-type transporter MlaC component